jgi:hypothetical protein
MLSNETLAMIIDIPELIFIGPDPAIPDDLR